MFRHNVCLLFDIRALSEFVVSETQAVYEAELDYESWAIYDQMAEGLDCVFSLELLHESLWALKPNLPQTQARDFQQNVFT